MDYLYFIIGYGLGFGSALALIFFLILFQKPDKVEELKEQAPIKRGL